MLNKSTPEIGIIIRQKGNGILVYFALNQEYRMKRNNICLRPMMIEYSFCIKIDNTIGKNS